MPTWTLTPENGSPTNFEIASYQADKNGIVMGFAVNADTGTKTFHIAPEGKQGELPGIVSGGLSALTNVAGAAGGFKMAEQAISAIDGEGKFQMGGSEAKVTELAGGLLGAFLAHAAAQTATKLYQNREIDKGDYYDDSNSLVFRGPIKVDGSGNMVA